MAPLCHRNLPPLCMPICGQVYELYWALRRDYRTLALTEALLTGLPLSYITIRQLESTSGTPGTFSDALSLPDRS